jgi:uncharacterized protein
MTASTPSPSAAPPSAPQSGTVGRLRAALTAALTSRDMIAAAAIRSALAAIGNAEAVAPRRSAGSAPAPDGPRRALDGSEHIAGALAGLGAAEAERRQLTEADIGEIVLAEITDRRSAADQYDRLDRTDRAERLRREAAVLSSVTSVS